MSYINSIYGKNGGNFQLRLKKIQYSIKDTVEGEKNEKTYFFDIIVEKRNKKKEVFETKVKPKDVKSPGWVVKATDGLATNCNTKELRFWFEEMVQTWLESDYVAREVIYDTCGWRKNGDRHFYVYSEGAIGAENCGIHAKESYELMINTQMKGTLNVFKEAWDMRSICQNNRVSSLIFVYFHTSLLTSLFEEAGFPVNFLMGVVGVTGSRKTSLCTAITKLFNRNNLGVDAEFTSTECGIEEKLSKYNDTMVLIDDYVEGISAQEQREVRRKLFILSRYCGNRILKQRMAYNISEDKRIFNSFKGCCLLTGEYITAINSSLARMFLVNIGRGDVDNQKLAYFQNERWILPTYAYDFLEWIAGKYEYVVYHIGKVLPQYRNQMIFKHSRYSEMYAVLMATQEVMLMYAIDKCFISEIEKVKFYQEFKQMIVSELRENERMLATQDIGSVLIAAIMDSINQGTLKANMLPCDTCNDIDATFQDEHYFYIQSKKLKCLFNDYIKKYEIKMNLDSSSSIAGYLETKNVLDIKMNSEGIRERARKLPQQGGNFKRYLWINKEKLVKAYHENCEHV